MINSLFRHLSSLKLALIGLSGLFIIVLWGTFVQIDLGIFYTQKQYFQSIFIYHEFDNGIKLPIFLGGVVWGTILTVGLIASLLVHIKWRFKNLGLILIHLGLIGLLVGSFLTGKLAKESQFILHEGETKNYSINRQTPELIIRTPNPVSSKTLPQTETQWIFPDDALQPGHKLQVPDLGTITINARYQNTEIRRYTTHHSPINSHLNGIGRFFNMIPIPLNQAQEGVNTISLILTITAPNGDTIGQWAVSQGLESDQLIQIKGRSYYIQLRDQRLYTDYTLTLKDFTHDVYPGTSIPKNFSSLVTINHPQTGENRDVLIYMNHPLRYQGNTYFQASFGDENRLSVLQVVKNPVWLFPYFSTLVITAGLIVQLMMMLIRFKGKSHG